MGVRRNFSRGDNVDISLILFQVANNAMQMDLRKRLSLLFLHHKENSPMKARAPFAFFEIVFRWSCRLFQFAKRLYFLSSLTVFAELGIIQYHYNCELWTTESELDLSYPQLRLLCSH